MAVVLSVAVHAAMFWQYRDALWSTPSAAERPAIVARLSVPAPAETSAPQQAKPVSTPEAKSESKPRPKPLPKVVTPQPVPVVAVSNPVEPAPRSEPVEQVAEPEVLEPIAESRPLQTSEASVLALAEAVAPVVGQLSEEEAIEALQHYLAELRAAIAAHKQYPALARRRGIEGEVKVSFTLLADGSVRDVRVSGGPRPLRSAARQAVHRAAQLPPPPAGVPSPMPVQYAMDFSLR